jgi:outer membrane protein assembly factor BamB
MVTLQRRTGPELVFLLLVSGLFSAGTAQDLPDKTSRPEATSWKIDLEPSRSNPVIADGVLYVGSGDGAVYALDPNTGETKWRFQTGENIPPNAFKSKIFPPGTSVTDIMAAAASEMKAQEAQGRRQVDMTPAVVSGSVFVGSEDRSFYAIDAATGQKKWSYEAGSGISFGYAVPAPVVTKGNVYFVSDAGLHAVDALTGKRKWLFETSQKRASNAPVLGDGVILLATGPVPSRSPTQGSLYALDPETGNTKWVTNVEGVDIGGPLTAGDMVLFSGTSALYAVDAASGKTKWKFDAPTRISGQPMLIAGKAICFNTDKDLFVLDLESGHQLWNLRIEEIIGFLADEHYVYVDTLRNGSRNSKQMMHAFSLYTGKEKWSRDLTGSMGKLAGNLGIQMVNDGIVYAGREHLQALDGATGKLLWTFDGPEPPGRGIWVRLVSANRIFLASSSVGAFDPHATERVARMYPGYLQTIDAKTGQPK